MDKIQVFLQGCIFIMLISAYYIISSQYVKSRLGIILVRVIPLYAITIFFALSKVMSVITYIIVIIMAVLLNGINDKRNERRIKGFYSKHRIN